MKKIVFTRSDGGVTVRVPSQRHLATFKTEVEGMVDIQAQNLPPGAVDIVQVDEANIPTDKSFRNAWEHAGGVFSVDMVKARDIQTAHIEAAKREKASDLIEREMMGGDITSERAALRAVDVTSQITAAKTPAALKSVWPAILGEQ